VAAEATIAERAWTATLGAVTGQIVDCFERREPRTLAREMTEAMLMELDTRNCWTLAEALGHAGPHRLQHFLSRAVVDHDLAHDRIAAWTAGELADQDAVLIVDETGDAQSSTDCVGAARQYSGALGGIGLCQVAVHLTYASRNGHAPIDRALYLGAEWAADEERRLLAGVPDETEFAPPSPSWRPPCSSALATCAYRPGGWPATRSTAERSCGRPPALWSAEDGGWKRTSSWPRASAASTRARPPAGTPGCAGL
jgi:hypothetical protein